ncbi:MAG: hypothetical protein ACYTJ0_01365 [Planctomycetota bacterium]|jgi:hypothetical protein
MCQYVVVGGYARIDDAAAGEVCERLARLDGVETFPLERDGAVGVLIEADDLDAAHAMLTGAVRRTPGVQGVFPIYVHAEDDAVPDGAARS